MPSRFALIVLFSVGVLCGANRAATIDEDAQSRIILGKLAGGGTIRTFRAPDGKWGLRVVGAGMASATQLAPVQLEFLDAKSNVTRFADGYDAVRKAGDGCVATAKLSPPAGGEFTVEDRWIVASNVLQLDRSVTVSGSAEGGFLSGITFNLDHELSWPEVNWFAPGMIYGGFAHLTETTIGGRAHYRPGDFTVRIREDRLPAPLLGVNFSDGSSLTVLDESPDGSTTRGDSHDFKAVPMVDERFRFGALGAEERGSKLTIGYWFPGSEGEVTYAGNTYPGGQLHQWRLRFHPIKAGFVQRYRVNFRFGRAEQFQEFYPAAWRWAWRTLQPRVNPQDLAVARHALVDTLAARAQATNGLTGIPNFVDAVQAERGVCDDKAVLGFCGKNLEAANYLLHEADLDSGPRGERLRQLGNAIADSFVKLKIAPPVGEGFSLKTGQPVCAIGNREVFLRSFGDDVKALLKAYRREKNNGRDHAEWLFWSREFADWLLTQQQPTGGFPRSWEPGTGKVVSASPNSSYNAVPLLVLLHQITGQQKYFDAAQRAAEFCWENGQSRGLFVGGTIDNPDVVDKEAATLSLEAYLILHEVTRDAKWLQRARAAAQFAETWIYCWNIPMPVNEDNAALHWKLGVPTTGLQLISTGHSLVDAYMAFDADEFADLFLRTKDPHFLEVARVLLHNTKAMLALPGRTYDLAGSGWQQEHWSLAPCRGFGLHRGWLPWVSTSHLNGIFGLMDLDPELFEKLAANQPVKK